MKKLLVLLSILLFTGNSFSQTSYADDSVYIGNNYYPQHEGNVYQYIMDESDYYNHYYDLLIRTIARDTLNHDYFYDNLTYRWLRYSETDKKIYVRTSSGEKVHMDFNFAHGDGFEHYQPYASQLTWPPTVYTGEKTLFSKLYKYKGYLVDWGSYGIMQRRQELYAEDFGIFSFLSANQKGGGSTSNIIMAIIYDSTGTPHEYTDHYKPDITIKPLTSINSRNFVIDSLKVTHLHNRFITTSMGHSLNFINTVNMESFYQKGDSIITCTDTQASNFSQVYYKVYQYLDTLLLKNGFSFNYRIVAKDKGIIPETSYSPDSGYYKCVWNFSTKVTDENTLPSTFFVYQNYPNPFNPSTVIKFNLPIRQLVTLTIYDMLGREVAVLLSEERDSGLNELVIDLRKFNLSSGTYFYRVKSGNYIETKKMLYLK